MKSNRMCTLCVSVLLMIFGVLLILCTPLLFEYIIRTQLVLSPESKVFKSWVHLPSLIPMDFYLFNWTNPEEINNPQVKPKVEQVGPYRFMMDLKKVNVTWNENGTVTYRQQKFWYFSPVGTNGSLQDRITTLNTPALSAAHMARSWNYFTQKGVSILLNRIYSNISVTKTIDELLFKGYPDGLTAMSNSQPFFNDPGMPQWDKFGWFYKRNGTLDDEKPYNMGTGINSTFAKIYNWNYWNQTPFYSENCGKVDGYSGDNFDASGDIIKFYLPDVCRYLKLHYIGDTEIGGIVGKKYVLDEHTLDNGTKYPENQCFNVGEGFPTGVFNMSSCRYGSPAIMSLPHFYEADPYYNNLVQGLNPNKEKHEFYMIVEPKTGIPLEANVKLQLNLFLHPVESISLYEYVPQMVFPIMWFNQKGSVPENELFKIQLLLNLPSIGSYSGIFMTITGVVLFIIIIILNVQLSKRKTVVRKSEEDVPLKSKVIDKTTDEIVIF